MGERTNIECEKKMCLGKIIWLYKGAFGHCPHGIKCFLAIASLSPVWLLNNPLIGQNPRILVKTDFRPLSTKLVPWREHLFCSCLWWIFKATTVRKLPQNTTWIWMEIWGQMWGENWILWGKAFLVKVAFPGILPTISKQSACWRYTR